MRDLRNFCLLILVSAGLAAAPASAETLEIAGFYPAGSDAAAASNSIAVERFSGPDGPRLSTLISDRLRSVVLDGQPYFSVLVEQLADEADAVLTGHVDPRFSEEDIEQTRDICWARDDDGDCTEYREAEVDCLRVTMDLRPQLRLIGANGNALWAPDLHKTDSQIYCPKLDDLPDFDPAVDRFLDEITTSARFALAPYYNRRNIRIMERRRGLEGDTRGAFRDAVRLTEHDEAAACAQFERLYADVADHPALTFNVGLCAEQRYDVNAAESFYQRALAFEDSDDEARAGLNRLAQRRRAELQMANHYGH